MATHDLNDEMNEILESGDPDQIEALLNSLEETDDGFSLKEGDPDSDSKPNADQDKPADQPAEQPKDNPEPAPEPDPNEDPDAGGQGSKIQGKHGNEEIPYGVLKGERQARQAAESRVKELEQEVSAHEQTQRKLDLLMKQLEENGLDPDRLPEEIELTDEVRQSLVEDFGDAGRLIIALKDQLSTQQSNQADQGQQQQSDSQGSPDSSAENQSDNHAEGQAAFLRNETLVGWAKSDPSRWEEAQRIDNLLQSDAEFQNSSFDERYAEVARRVQMMFGDAPPAGDVSGDDAANLDKAKQAADAEVDLPNSLSNLGAAGSAERPFIETLAEKSYEEIEAEMAKMTPDQQEKLLAQIS